MNSYFADLHVHVGRSSGGEPIKWATSKDLTFENIAKEALFRKGIQIVGVVDCISPYIIDDIENLLSKGELQELQGGGMLYRDSQVMIAGVELETHEFKGGTAHSLCFFRDFRSLKLFAAEVGKYIKNIHNCCSMTRLSARELLDIVERYQGLFIPAHVFTPHKSFYGSCCTSLRDIFEPAAFERIPAIEMGLSADSYMASQLSELDGKGLLSNSDAHSPGKIGREYNLLEMEAPTFDEIVLALKSLKGRRIAANYGLDPRLGKYHRTYCLKCDNVIPGEPPVLKCPVVGKHRVVTGVRDRLTVIRDRNEPDIGKRPHYQYQVPLEFVPGVSARVLERLLERFGTEMKILHEASFDDLTSVVGKDTAATIISARDGRLSIQEGGGGVYGRLDL